MKTTKLLNSAFATNFMLYWQAHVAHVNTVGRNFISDHQLLGEIYEDAQENIDDLAEFLRIMGEDMPTKLEIVLAKSEIADTTKIQADTGYIKTVYAAVECMIELYRELYEACEEEKYYALGNFVQDRLLTHEKQCWKLRSILGERK